MKLGISLAKGVLCFHFNVMTKQATPPGLIVTRFAPSPTGFLHLGHAYAALFAHRAAKSAGGRFLLRIEDIDQGRCRPEFEEALYEDLAWLGLDWETPVRRQSEGLADFTAALEVLKRQDLLYPCFCTRADIRAEIDAANGAPHLIPTGPDGPIYPGLCRHLTVAEQHQRIAAGTPYALRLNMDKALKMAGPLTWTDLGKGKIKARPEIFGDVVLARKDTPTSYHLAVCVDDHRQNITLVTRGEDLFAATHIHRLLQKLLDLDTPTYHHHGLLLGDDGRRLAKRDKAQTLRELRKSGLKTLDILHMCGCV